MSLTTCKCIRVNRKKIFSESRKKKQMKFGRQERFQSELHCVKHTGLIRHL